jgi:peptidyl-prolyl cis-trans isomerase B (cyclophilin B)
MIRLTTTMGNIDIELDFDKAPKSAANFQQYVEDGHFDGTIFHRIIDNFMIQGGGMLPDMSQKDTRATIENEADNGLKNVKGSLAMARTNDPHSASSQFFINVADNAFLDHTAPTTQGWGYCVFGKVVDGMDVVETMKGVSTGSRSGHQDVPNEDVLIEKAEVINAE